MSRQPRCLFTLCLFLTLGAGTCSFAEDTAPVPTPAQMLPPPAPLKSPIALFRTLLASAPAEREKILAGRTPEKRQGILEKLKEYEALRPDERALRLKTTELQWYLSRLLPLSPAVRAREVVGIPGGDRRMVEDRLKLWDLLPADQQRWFLDTQLANSTTPPPAPPQPGPVGDSAAANGSIAVWNSLQPDQRDEMVVRFRQFFDLTDAEKQRTLHVLSPAEVTQIRQSLQTFAKLPPLRQQRCLQAFSKFASMTDDERREFLENAERWKEMSPNERQAWRRLVSRLPSPPPLPPGMRPALPALPPLPPDFPAPVDSSGQSLQPALATNAGG
jgi:hypothetical protein